MKAIFVALMLWIAIQAPAQRSPSFKKETIQVGKIQVVAEIADDEPERSHGLMYRHKLAAGTGMLFVFDDETTRGFWMKNTFVPLSIGFFDKNGVLVEIQDMDAVKSEMQADIPQYQSQKAAQFALEVPRGWFKKVKIKLGDRLVRHHQSR